MVDKFKTIGQLSAGGFGTDKLINTNAFIPLEVDGVTVNMHVGSLLSAIDATGMSLNIDTLSGGMTGAYRFSTKQSVLANGFPESAVKYGADSVTIVVTDADTSGKYATQKVAYLPDSSYATQEIVEWSRFKNGGDWGEWKKSEQVAIPDATIGTKGIVQLAMTINRDNTLVPTSLLVFNALSKKLTTGDVIEAVDNMRDDGLYRHLSPVAPPLDSTGSLLVSGDGTIQTFFSQNDGSIYSRTSPNKTSSFAEWVKIGPFSIDELISTQANNATVLRDGKIFTPKAAYQIIPGDNSIGYYPEDDITKVAVNIANKEGNTLQLIAGSNGGLFVDGSGGSTGGDIIDLPSDTVLDSVKSAGLYYINGSPASSSQGFPFPMSTGDKAVMNVAAVTYSGMDVVMQTVMAFSPDGASIGLTGITYRYFANEWSAWATTASDAYIKLSTVSSLPRPQAGINVGSTRGIGASAYSYIKPGSGGPLASGAPSTLEGNVLAIPYSYKSGVSGAFAGSIIATDSAGDLFVSAEVDSTANPVWRKVAFEGDAPAGTFAAPTVPIAAGVNLNTMVTPGAYYQSTSGNATVTLNYPVAGGVGSLEVYRTGDNFLRQIFTAADGVEYVRRRTSATAWTSWAEIEMPYITTSRYTNLARNANLNNTLKVGFYSTQGPIAANLNYPVLAEGLQAVLLVQDRNEVSGDARLITQTLTADNGITWVRFRSELGAGAGTWSKWSMVSISSAYGGLDISLPSVSLNTIRTPGTYMQNNAAAVTNGNMYPAPGQLGYLVVRAMYKSGETVNTPAICRQEYYSNSAPYDMWYRVALSATAWSPWKVSGVVRAMPRVSTTELTDVSTTSPTTITIEGCAPNTPHILNSRFLVETLLTDNIIGIAYEAEPDVVMFQDINNMIMMYERNVVSDGDGRISFNINVTRRKGDAPINFTPFISCVPWVVSN